MYKNKYPSIFSKSNGGYCVYYSPNSFYNTRSFGNGGIFSISKFSAPTIAFLAF